MTTWEEAARDAIDPLRRGLSLRYEFLDLLAEIESYLDDERAGHGVSAFHYILDDAIQGYLKETDDLQSYQDVVDVVLTTIASKQHDYGHGNILWAGLDGVIVRMHDKVERLKNLKTRTKVNLEAVADSWLDIAGYAIIALMLKNGTFELELAADQPKSDEAELDEAIDLAVAAARSIELQPDSVMMITRVQHEEFMEGDHVKWTASGGEPRRASPSVCQAYATPGTDRLFLLIGDEDARGRYLTRDQFLEVMGMFLEAAAVQWGEDNE